MGYKSPYMRFGHTRYEKDIVKLRRYDLKYRDEAYKDAMRLVDEVDHMHDASPNYIVNVIEYSGACKDAFERGLITDDDDAMLVLRYGKSALGQDEYDWMKDELAKKGEEVNDQWTV